MMTPVVVEFVNPPAETVTEYVPGGRASKLYSPCPLLTAARSNALAGLLAVTVALATRFPLGSLTETCRSPLAAPCAKTMVLKNRVLRNRRARFKPTNLRMVIEFLQRNCQSTGAKVRTPARVGLAGLRTCPKKWKG